MGISVRRRRLCWWSYSLLGAIEALERRDLFAGFVAYNGLSPGSASAANVSYFAEGIPDQAASGELIDFATGATTGVVLTVSQVSSSISSSGGIPQPGTDAHEIFSGIVDFNGPARNVELNNDSEYVYTIEELSPGASYEVAGTASRGGTATDRWVLVELQGAESFEVAHSEGVGVVTAGLLPNQVAIWTGANHRANEGFVAQWTDIDPGDDGVIHIVNRKYQGTIPTELDAEGIANGLRGYALSALRVKELAATSPPQLDLGRIVELKPTEALVSALLIQSGGERPQGLVYFGRSDGGTDPTKWDQVFDVSRTEQVLSHLFSGLTPQTTYYFRFAAQNSLGKSWSAETTKLVTPELGPPVLRMLPVRAVGAISATLEGILDRTGNDPPLVTLVLGKTNGGQDVAKWDRQISLGVLGELDPQSTPFASLITGLTPETDYFYAAVAQNRVGTVWADAASFRTDAVAPVVINEFVASNSTSYTTRLRSTAGGPLGETLSPDWIELYNTSTSSIDLSGYHLTNDADAKKWRFPAGSTLAGGAYLIVFASAENVLSPALDQRGSLHTNFRLSSNAGESLQLTDPEGQPVFGFENLPQQSQDISYGLENVDQPRFYPSPTPGRINADDAPQVPTLSLSSQTFQNPLTLEITAADPADKIYYTLDESAPTTNSLLYQGALTISSTVRVRAIAVGPNGKSSAGVSSSFVRIDTALANRTSDLPLLVVETFGDGIGGSFQDSFFGIIEPGEDGISRLTESFDLETQAGIHVRGSSSAGFSKKQYRVEFWDERGQDRKLPLLGMPREADWILYGPGVYDRALINNPLMFEISNQMGRYAPRTKWVEVYLDSGGNGISASDYVGVYAFVEVVETDDDRVDIEPLTTGAGGQPVQGGFIWKNDRGSPYVEPENPNTAQVNYINSWIDGLESSSSGANFKDPDRGYARYADVGSFIDHNLLNLLAMNVDALRLSSYYYKTADGKLEAGPIWDFDRALESTDGRDDNPRMWFGSGDSTRYFNDDSRTMIWWSNMFRDPDFAQQYIDRWFELRNTVFSETQLFATIDAVAAPLRSAAGRDYARWSGSRFGSFTGELNHMKDWLRSRMAWIDSQWIAPPRVEVAPGASGERVITVTATGNAYYTLDGSDPRGEDGILRPDAIRVTGPITLRDSTTFTTRVFTPGHGRRNGYVETGDDWSPPVTLAVFVEPNATAADIAITEINYHPYGPVADSPEAIWEEDEFEFVEITNIAPYAVNLDGLQFVETSVQGSPQGIEFVFAPQVIAPYESIVIVENIAAFHARYGTAPRIALEKTDQGSGQGVYGGRLANSGELLTLLDSQNQVLRSFAWDDAWHESTDGDGPSLELAEVWRLSTTELERADRWRPSSVRGGTPGLAVSAGDLNADRQLDSRDIDLLFLQLGTVNPSRWFDLNQDMLIDSQDTRYWTETIVGTKTGDTQLDGRVSFEDFLVLAQSFGQANRSWKDGDFDGDHTVTFADFLILSANFGFERPLRNLFVSISNPAGK